MKILSSLPHEPSSHFAAREQAHSVGYTIDVRRPLRRWLSIDDPINIERGDQWVGGTFWDLPLELAAVADKCIVQGFGQGIEEIRGFN